MNLFPEHITIEDEQIPVEQWINNNKTDSGIASDLAQFLTEWYSPDDHLQVSTSGSTGIPKTIQLQKAFVAESALRTIRYFRLEKNNKVLLCLPMQFIAGKLMVVRALLGNLSLYATDPTTSFSFLQSSKFHFAAMVPNQVDKILANEPQKGLWLHNIDQLLIGGSAIPWRISQKLKNADTQCYSSYGMTETATHIAIRKLNGEGADGYYHCLEGIGVQISPGGCLQIMMPGINQPYLQTTDLAELKDKHTFRILGRSDHVIISGGIKFSPELIEKKLEPFIEEPFLISHMPHESLGQQLVLVIEGPHNKETVIRLKNLCRHYLARYEQPKHIRFLSRIPRTVNGKPDRNKISIADI